MKGFVSDKQTDERGARMRSQRHYVVAVHVTIILILANPVRSVSLFGFQRTPAANIDKIPSPLHNKHHGTAIA